MTPAERAKKAYSAALQALAANTQSALAISMGTSESTINRIKTERLEESLLLLAHLGMKVVPVNFKCVDAVAYEFLITTHQRVMQRAPELIWEQEE